MTDATTFDARVYQTEVYKGRQVTTYWVRWRVGGRLWKEPFRTVAQADSFRSSLLTAARKGEAFSVASGRPVTWEREKTATGWYEFACAYADLKWKQASAIPQGHRTGANHGDPGHAGRNPRPTR